MSIYENYDDACFDIACRIENEKQRRNISRLGGDWYKEYEYIICELNVNNSDGGANYLQYDKSINYKNVIESQRYVKFVENLTKNNESLIKEALEKAEKRKNQKEAAKAKEIELEKQKAKNRLENDRKFAENYFKTDSNEAKDNPISKDIIERISRVAMHTNDRDMIEWVLKHR
jgi:hypothetical protein